MNILKFEDIKPGDKLIDVLAGDNEQAHIVMFVGGFPGYDYCADHPNGCMVRMICLDVGHWLDNASKDLQICKYCFNGIIDQRNLSEALEEKFRDSDFKNMVQEGIDKALLEYRRNHEATSDTNS